MAKKAIQLWPDSYIAFGAKLYSFTWIPIQLCEVTSIRLLLCVGIKVVDERLISLIYVRGYNIYVRGYLDLRTWSLRLRTQTKEIHYVKALFSSREWYFFLRWIRGIRAIKRRAYVSLRKGHIGQLGVRCLSTISRTGLYNSLIRCGEVTQIRASLPIFRLSPWGQIPIDRYLLASLQPITLPANFHPSVYAGLWGT